jgi:hypothetical protein
MHEPETELGYPNSDMEATNISPVAIYYFAVISYIHHDNYAATGDIWSRGG